MAKGGKPFTLWLPKMEVFPGGWLFRPWRAWPESNRLPPAVLAVVLAKDTSRPYRRHPRAAIFPVAWDFP